MYLIGGPFWRKSRRHNILQFVICTDLPMDCVGLYVNWSRFTITISPSPSRHHHLIIAISPSHFIQASMVHFHKIRGIFLKSEIGPAQKFYICSITQLVTDNLSVTKLIIEIRNNALHGGKTLNIC